VSNLPESLACLVLSKRKVKTVHLQKGNSKHLMKGQESPGATPETVEEEGADPPQRLVSPPAL